MNHLLIVNAIFMLYLGVIWNKTDSINLSIKFVFVFLAVSNLFAYFLNAGYIVKL